MENFNIVWHYKDLLLKGLGYTVFVSVAAILIALCVGMLLSVMRMGGDSFPEAFAELKNGKIDLVAQNYASCAADAGGFP